MNTKNVTDYLQTLHDLIPAIQMGVVPPSTGITYNKFAGRLDIGTTQSIISTCHNENPFNTTGTQLYISSADATANQVIFLEGVDQNYEVKQVNIQLQGQTAIPLTTNFRTIWRGYNNDSTDLTGDAYVGSEATPTDGVPADENMYCNIISIINGKLVNQTLTSIFTIPKGYNGFVTSWYCSAPKSADIDFTAYIREKDKVFRYVERMALYQTSFKKDLPFIRIPEFADIKVMGATQNANYNGTTIYDLTLVSKDYLNKIRRLDFR